MTRYVFVIDLKRCYGCYSCQAACKAANYTPPGVFWSRVLSGEAGTYPTVKRQKLPLLCMHCKEPECEKVCPTKATKIEENGIVTIDKNLCVGCKYCIVACPYGARYFVPEWRSYFPVVKELLSLYPDADKLSPYEEYARQRWIERLGIGTTTKCDFCKERVQQGLQPACVQACPGKARYFGDLDDPESEVSLLIKTERGFQLNPEFGTDPSVYYLPVR